MARLRAFLGITQPEFAKIIGCKLMVLQNIESDRTSLSYELAHRVYVATDVDLNWLLDNDPAAAIKAQDGKDYTHEHYAVAQAIESSGLTWALGVSAKPYKLIGLLRRVSDIVEAAGRQGGSTVDVVYWKLNHCIQQIEKDHNVEYSGSPNPNVDDLAEHLKLMVEKDGYLEQVSVLQEVKEEILEKLHNSDPVSSEENVQDLSNTVEKEIQAAIARKIPDPDPEALAKLAGPTTDHINRKEEERRAGGKIKSSTRSVRRHRENPA